jgi:hypothetical protein
VALGEAAVKALVAVAHKALPDLTDQQLAKLASELGGVQPTAVGLIEADSGKKVVDEEAYNQLHADLRKLRKRAQEAEQARDELQSQLGDTDQTHRGLADKLKATEALTGKLLKQARERWDGLAKVLPDKPELRAKFALVDPNDEKAKPLTDQQVLDNLDRFAEYAELGVLKYPAGTQTNQQQANQPRPGAGGPANGMEQGVDAAYGSFYAKPGATASS